MPLPPLNGLLALEAVIRTGGVRRAADELRISQPAVSQRLRGLEAYFGRPLIEKTPTGFRATDDVAAYGVRLGRAVEELRAASEDFRRESSAASNRLSIALLSTFAQRWLIPRLIDFQARHPKIDVHLLTTSNPADLAREDADLSIRCGDGNWRGHRARFLAANRIFPVASPDFVRRGLLGRPMDLTKTTLIRVDADPRGGDWDRWFAAAGLPSLQPARWQTYATSTHALEAATAGLGVAMAHSPFVADSMAAGHLVEPFAVSAPDPDGDYYVVRREGGGAHASIGRFEAWLAALSGGRVAE